MELENKKFRCHGSIVLEQCAKVLTTLLVLFFLNIDVFLEDNFGAESDGIIITLIIIGIVVFITIIVLALAIVRWRKTTIVIENDAIIWEKNTLNRKKQTIGIKSISSINIERNIFERIIGTAKVKLDTNSLSTADTTDVVFLFKYEDAIRYKEYLETKVQKAGNKSTEQQEAGHIAGRAEVENNAAGEGEQEASCREETIIAEYVSSPKEIILHCIYSLSLVPVIVGIIVTVFGILNIVETVKNGTGNIEDVIPVSILMISVGYATLKSVFGKIFQFYNLTVARKGNRLYMKYGLFRLKEYVIPIEKINCIHVKQTLIGRLFKRYNVSMECVGVADEEYETAQLTLSLTKEEIYRRLGKLLPECETSQTTALQRMPFKAVYHKLEKVLVFIFFVICLLVGLLIAMNAMRFGEEDRGFVVAVAIGIICIYMCIIVGITLQMKTEAVGFGKSHIVIVTGTFGRDMVSVPYGKIQYVTITRSPLNRFTGLISGQINILSNIRNITKRLPYVKEEVVGMLIEKII